MTTTTASASRDRGFVAPMTMILLAVLLVFAALAIDVGSWMAQASRQQRAADAAALAAVVWLPDENTAITVARNIAERNGFDHDDPDVNVAVGFPSHNEVTVSITAPGQLYLGGLVTDDVTLARDATARYVLPVPLGSPRNFFGLGHILRSSNPFRENLWLSTNTWCTDKVDGDRHQSRWFLNRSGETSASPGSYTSGYCDGSSHGAQDNAEYRSNGYEYYVEAPEGRTAAIQVLLYDPQYLRSSGAGSAGDLALETGAHTYHAALYSADDTPFDDSDNPLKCQQTFTSGTGYTPGSYLGRSHWNLLCTIGVGDPSGRYILRFSNTANETGSAGANNYGIVARYQGAPGNGLCDGRVDTMCPRVYGKDAISVFANISGATAEFFLAEVEEDHAGKDLVVSLYDPGEGASTIEIMQPTGSNSWSPVPFTWTATNNFPYANNAMSGSGTVLDVTNLPGTNHGRFNGELVTITVPLPPTYDPPDDNPWWRIRYVTATAPTDRTTWSVRIIGDPVHLTD